jgi:hypothetical protein
MLCMFVLHFLCLSLEYYGGFVVNCFDLGLGFFDGLVFYST